MCFDFEKTKQWELFNAPECNIGYETLNPDKIQEIFDEEASAEYEILSNGEIRLIPKESAESDSNQNIQLNLFPNDWKF